LLLGWVAVAWLGFGVMTITKTVDWTLELPKQNASTPNILLIWLLIFICK
jgi:hypothetical protein